MSILIKSIDMPKNGELTIAFASNKNGENTTALILDGKGNPVEHKGVTEIPTPHGRLIDADAHIKLFKENFCGERCRRNHDCSTCGIDMYIRIVENEATVIEAEVSE